MLLNGYICSLYLKSDLGYLTSLVSHFTGKNQTQIALLSRALPMKYFLTSIAMSNISGLALED